MPRRVIELDSDDESMASPSNPAVRERPLQLSPTIPEEVPHAEDERDAREHRSVMHLGEWVGEDEEQTLASKHAPTTSRTAQGGWRELGDDLGQGEGPSDGVASQAPDRACYRVKLAFAGANHQQ